MLVNNHRILKIIASICLTGLVVAALTAWSNPAIGYELDIYTSTPFAVWLFIILATLGGISIIVHQVATKGYENSNLWLMGFFVLILSRVSTMYIPYIRGYLTWDGDNISHVGLLKDIILTGHFSGNNYYPVTHSLLSQTVLITGISNFTVTNLSTTFLSVMYMLSSYLLATIALSHRGQRIIATLVTGTVVLQSPGFNIDILLLPNGWSILLLPLVFFCFFKVEEIQYRVLFLVFLVLYPFFHPLSSLMMMIFLAVIILTPLLFHLVMKRRWSLVAISSQFLFQSVLIEAAILLPWLLAFQAFNPNLRMLWRQITTGFGPDVIGDMQNQLGKVSTGLIDSLIIFLKLYGVSFGVIALALIGIILLTKQIIRGEIQRETSVLVFLFGVFISVGLLYFLYLLGAPGLEAIGATRLLSYTTTFTPVLSGYALFELLRRVKTKLLAYTGLICLIMTLSFLGIRSLYYSPYIIQPNLQITQMNMKGMGWLFSEKSTSISFVSVTSLPNRYADGILGTVESSRRNDITSNLIHFPDHFAYNIYDTIGEQYSDNKYLAITKLDRILFNTVWRSVDRFNDDDFIKLDGDTTVDKIYSNKELDAYYIFGLNN